MKLALVAVGQRLPAWAETACEDYGQAVIYKGGVAEQPDAFELLWIQ